MYQCKEWAGSKDGDGYGMKRYMGKVWRVHRLVFWLIHKRTPAVVMHICDNPACFNPAHLIAGTRDSNNKDRARKGRSADTSGENHSQAVLTKQQVDMIRNSEKFYGINTVLGKYYGVHHSTISKIRKGVLWANT